MSPKRSTSAAARTKKPSRRSAATRKTTSATKPMSGSRQARAHADTIAALPLRVRIEIDKALILEEAPLDTVEAVHAHFALGRRHSIDLETFRHYAEGVKHVHAIGYADLLARALLAQEGAPAREAQMDLMTHRLACRIAKLLAEEEGISVSELARLASSAASLRRAVLEADERRLKREGQADTEEPFGESLDRAIRRVYGIELPDSASTT